MKPFFDHIRETLGPLSQSQVDGINALLAATDGMSTDHRAYVLATAWHETARTMQPITEFGSRKYFDKYDAGTSIGKVLGNTIKGDGYKYRGRGYVQITGRKNYQKASAIVHADLVANPELALDPDTAAIIIVDGMTRGWFTGKAMKDYADFESMRRVVNGNDKAKTIAGYAATFKAALALAGNVPDKPVPVPPLPMPPKPPAPAGEAPSGFWAMLISFIAALFNRKGTKP